MVNGGSMNKRVSLFAVVVLLGVVSVITAWSAFGSNQDSTHRRVNTADGLAQDPPRKTLRDVARERDVEQIHGVTVISEGDTESEDIEQIAKHANTIVLGKIVESKSDFDKSGDRIETIHLVEVSRVLKADTPVTSPLRLFRQGGTVYVNGHTASVTVKGNEQFIVGQKYLFFLTWLPRYQVHVLTGGLTSAFLVGDNFKIRSLSTSESNSIKLKYDGADLESIINDVLKQQ